MPRGYGGFEKDNELAYADYVETPDETKARKAAEVEAKRQKNRKKARVLRANLGRILNATSLKVKEEEVQITEGDLEFIHGGREFDLMQRQKCCENRYVDHELQNPQAEIAFIIKALFPVMIEYALTTVFGLFMTYDIRLRVYFYPNSPTYALISLCLIHDPEWGCWVGLNLFGRLIRTVKFELPMLLMRALAISNLFAASQLYSEYFLWEIIFRDPTVISGSTIIQLEERLRITHPFPESWLDLPDDMTKNDFLNRKEFTQAFFGGLFGFSLFLPVFCIIVGLLICSRKKDLTRHHVTGHWMQRAAAIASIIPPSIVFFTNDLFTYLPGPRSYNFMQTYPIGLMSMACAVFVSTMWRPLFDGKSCFNVHKDDYWYFGFMFTI